AVLILPCHHGNVVDREALEDFSNNNPNTSIPTNCAVMRGLELDFTGVQIRLNLPLQLYGNHSIKVFSDAYIRHSRHWDRPIVEFSYEREDKECRRKCDNGNYSIFSTPSCLGRITSDREISEC
ncbi:hypothetical protein PFISCL1PPCAC_2565, partial [Pristionchus fissidentatus]